MYNTHADCRKKILLIKSTALGYKINVAIKHLPSSENIKLDN